MPNPILNAEIAIVGSGLTGYLAAAALADAGCPNVTVYDALQHPSEFDLARPYSQVIYRTGQRLLEKLPLVEADFKKVAFCQHVRVATTLAPDGTSSVVSSTPPKGPLYWILKAHMLDALDTSVRRHYPAVTFRFGTPVKDVIIPDDTDSKKGTTLVVVKDGKDEHVKVDVVLACDGQYSVIRKIMAEKDKHQEGKSLPIKSKRGMQLYSRTSGSTGLRVKGITLLDNPVVSAPGQSVEYAMPSMIYTFKGDRGHGRGDLDAFDMILLPVCAGHTETRRAAMCVREGHRLLKVQTANEMYELFKENFPQVDLDRFTSRELLGEFATVQANTFPPVQRPMSLVGHFGNGSGLAFVGDAAHSFPTDSAQGINSAFQDVEALLDIVREMGSEDKADKAWKDVLEKYEEMRDEESWILTRIAAVSSPYQYGQNGLGQLRYALNKQVRKALCSVVPGGYFADLDTLVRQDMSYKKVATLNRIGTMLGAAVSAAVLAAPVVIAKMIQAGKEEEDDGERNADSGGQTVEQAA